MSFNYKNNSNDYTLSSILLNHNIQNFTATAAQDTFVISDGYAVGAVYVIQNGQWLSNEDFTATDGTNVVLTVPATLGDQIEIVSLGSFSVLDSALQSASETTFTPTGDIVATNVQSAIAELDTEKLAYADYTASDVLTKLLTVDGAGSGLDADTLDGQEGAYYAPKDSPALTGTPTAPTAATGTDTTQIATTEFVQQELDALSVTVRTMIVADKKTSGTGGGTAIAGSWNTRDLNTILYNNIAGASLASNLITLPAGTYIVRGHMQAFACNTHHSRLYNVTASSAISTVAGTSSDLSSASSTGNTAHIDGAFTITSTSTIRMEHWMQTSTGANDFGYPTSIAGTDEEYATIIITKVG